MKQLKIFTSTILDRETNIPNFYKTHQVHSMTIDNTGEHPRYLIEYEAGPDSKEFQAIAEFIDMAIGGMECFLNNDLNEAIDQFETIGKIKGFPLRNPGSGWNDQATYDTQTKERCLEWAHEINTAIPKLVKMRYQARKEAIMIHPAELKKLIPYVSEHLNLRQEEYREQMQEKKKGKRPDEQVIRWYHNEKEAKQIVTEYIKHNL